MEKCVRDQKAKAPLPALPAAQREEKLNGDAVKEKKFHM